MRTGLFLQREGPGSEPGNSLLCPDGSLEAAVLLYGVLGVLQCRASLVHKQRIQPAWIRLRRVVLGAS